ncbi:hypothetical protein [Cupriavidus sp. Agwp_2]|uniref:hypothetical protein n=1 Tax=Cupriavidus sp. Agwp_2 TaxID=2897324 RepID=UPI00346005A3
MNEKQAEREALTTAAEVAAFIDRKADDYANRFGFGVAGTLSFGSQVKMDHYTSLTELAEEIRALAAPSAGAPQHNRRITPGLYRVNWKSGGSSLCAIGMASNGNNWIAPANWVEPATIADLEANGTWADAAGLERLVSASPADQVEDAKRLDFLDGLNHRLNEHYGTVYGWELILSPNIVRLMNGPGGRGHLAAIDLNDSKARGAKSCRAAIDAAMSASKEPK